MEFGNLKKRVALGLAGVMAFTMAAPVGLTGQQGAVTKAAPVWDGYEFSATAVTTVEEEGIIRVAELKTPTLAALAEKEVKQLDVSGAEELGEARLITSSVINLDRANDFKDASAGVDTNATYVQSYFTATVPTTATDASGTVTVTKSMSVSRATGDGELRASDNCTGAVYFYAKTAGTEKLTLTARGVSGGKIEVGSLNLTVVNPNGVDFDIRTGKSDKTVVNAITMNNTNSYGVYAKINYTGNSNIRTMRVDNNNVSLIRVNTDGTDDIDVPWNQNPAEMYTEDEVGGANLAKNWDDGTSFSPDGKKSDYTKWAFIGLIPNKNSSGDATLTVKFAYEVTRNGKTTAKWTAPQTIAVKVENKKNVVSVGYAGTTKQISLTSEDDITVNKGETHNWITDEDHPAYISSTVNEAINSGYAIRLNNSIRELPINATTDRASDGAKLSYSVQSSGVDTDGYGLADYISVTNEGLVTLNSTLGKGVTKTGVVTIVSTPGGTNFNASKYIHIPVKVSNKVDANLSVYDEDGTAVVSKNGVLLQDEKENVHKEKATVWLSSQDKTSKTISYVSNVPSNYIEWKSDNKDVTVIDNGDGTLTVATTKKAGADITAKITATVKETPDTEQAIEVTFTVKATDKLVVNDLTCEDDAIYLNYNGNKEHQFEASFKYGNSPKFEVVKNNGKGDYSTIEDTDVTLTNYGGKLTLNNSNQGVTLVRVSGDDNSEAKALAYKIITVYRNINQEETIDTITTTESKKELVVGEQYAIAAVSAKGDTLTFSSDNNAVASVDPNTGIVTANGKGLAVVTVKGANYGGTTTVAISVSDKPQEEDSVTGTASYSIKVGKTVESDAKSSLGNALTWSTSNKNVATVSQNGVIKGVKAGTANITATAEKSGAKFVIKVTVSKNANTLKATGKKVTKKVKLNKKNKTTKKFTIAASSAIKVSNAKGAVTYAKKSGNSKITVAKNGKITVKKGIKKGTYKVKVNVTAAGNNTYNKATKVATVTIVIKKK